MTAAFLAPYTRQRFTDPNGNPLSYGFVYTYEAGTTTPIATYIDSTATTVNTNPIVLDAFGGAAIWILPNVAYKFNVTDKLGNTLPGYPVDQIIDAALLSIYGGVDTGVANAYVLNFSSPVPPGTDGQVVYWLPSNSNTGPSTINVNNAGPQPILNPNGTQLGANQIIAGQFVSIISINGTWQLYGGSGVGVNVGTFGAEFPIPSATTTDLGSAPGHNVQILGTTTITSFGASAQTGAPIYIVRMTGAVILTYSSALILPGNTNITTSAGDSFLAEYMGSGNWRVLIYQYANGVGNSRVKPSDTSRLSTTTLTADPDLVTNNLFVGQYAIELYLIFDSVASGAGFKFASTGTAVDSRAAMPALADGFVNGAAYGPKSDPFYGTTVAFASVSTSANGNQTLYKGSLLVGTAGTFGIQWAQNSSTASNTTLRAGSYLTCSLLGTGISSNATTHLYTTASSGTETIPNGVNTMTIEVFGSSGNGAPGFTGTGPTFAGGGGGGSGGYSLSTYTVTGQGGKNMTYTVGAVASSSSVVSGTFAITTMTAANGNAGTAATSPTLPGTGGSGGFASGGTAVNTTGNSGGNGLNDAGGGFGGAGGAGLPGINYGGAAGGVGHKGSGSGAPGGVGAIAFSYV